MRRSVVGFVGVVIVFVTPYGTRAEETSAKVSPLQIAIWNPVQLVPDDWDIYGLRLNLLYGNNRDLVGLDLGLVNSARAFEGVQLGFMNIPIESIPTFGSSSVGVQAGIVNISSGALAGLQIGGLGCAVMGRMAGLQIGMLCDANVSMTGLQASGGLCGGSSSGTMNGVQIGTTLIPMIFGSPLSSNCANELNGIQIGLWCNKAGTARGLQIALINIADKMTGVQIGLANIIKESPVPFFPIINAHF
ncbi:MAG: hypothetical protein WCO26_22020 [Deltaproteobacteria bacterium]